MCGQGWWRVPAPGRRGRPSRRDQARPQLGLGTTGGACEGKGTGGPAATPSAERGRAGRGRRRHRDLTRPRRGPTQVSRRAPRCSSRSRGREPQPPPGLASRSRPSPGFAAHLVGRPGCPGAGSPGWARLRARRPHGGARGNPAPRRPPAPRVSGLAPLARGELGRRPREGSEGARTAGVERGDLAGEKLESGSGGGVTLLRFFASRRAYIGAGGGGLPSPPARAAARGRHSLVPAQAGSRRRRREQRAPLPPRPPRARRESPARLGRHPPSSARGA